VQGSVIREGNLAVAHVLIAARHFAFYAESKASETGEPLDILSLFFMYLW
jgi:hypothetical protein